MPKSILVIQKILLLTRQKLWGSHISNAKISEIFINKPVWAQFGHSGYPEMGEGGPGAILDIHPILTGAQNYGDPIF